MLPSNTPKPQSKHSVLRDIYESFNKALFDKDLKPPSERYKSREVLLRNLHNSIKYGGNDQSNGQNRLQSFNERINQFLKNCIEDTPQANSDLQDLINWYEDPSHEKERPDELLKRVFSRFVGFSLMKVDPLYRQIYYVDIFHPLLQPGLIETIKQYVLVPFDHGSVGFAARIGGLSLANSLSDPRGTVASEDLSMGNVSIMMCGIGKQPADDRVTAENSSRLVPPPELRWNFQIAEEDWVDSFEAGTDLSGAVVFCFFPTPNVFSNLRSTSQPAKESGLDPQTPFRLFKEVCRAYEHSLLSHAYSAQAKFVSKRTDEALQAEHGKIDALDVLASLETTDNPTGGLFAIRSDKKDVRICVPRVEANLAHHVAREPAIQSHLQYDSDVSVAMPAMQRGPLFRALLANTVSLNLGSPDGQRPLLKIIFHFAQEAGTSQAHDFLNDQPNVPTIKDFFEQIQEKYFQVFQSLLLKQGDGSTSTIREGFEEGKLSVDAYEGVAQLIGRILCSGIGDTETQFAFANEATESPKGLGGKVAQFLALPPQVTIPDVTPSQIKSEMEELDRLGKKLRDNLLGVSTYYWSPHHIDPEQSNAPVQALDPVIGENLTRRINEAWRSGQEDNPSVRRLLRMLCLKALLDNEQISIAYGGQYVIPVKNDLSSDYDLDFEIERIPDGPEGQLKFVFLSEGKKVAETKWISRPRYRLAGLFLNKSNLEQWVRTSITIWDNNELNSDQIITELTGADLRARKVDWSEIWENQDTGYFDDWKVSFYTIDGKCSNLGIELARRMKYFEDRLQEKADVVLSRYAKGAAHGFKNALLLPPLFLKRNKNLTNPVEMQDNTNVANLLLQQLQLQAQLFFWVMAPDRFQLEKDDSRQRQRWPSLNSGIVSSFSLLLGTSIVFNTTPTPAFKGRIKEEDGEILRNAGKLAALNALGLLSIGEQSSAEDIQYLLDQTANSIPNFNMTVNFSPILNETLKVESVARGALEGILMELAQNAVRAALNCPSDTETYVRMNVATTENGTKITMTNLATVEDAKKLWRVGPNAHKERHGASGGIRGLTQVKAFEENLKADLPVQLDWPCPPDTDELEDLVEISWSVRLGSWGGENDETRSF